MILEILYSSIKVNIKKNVQPETKTNKQQDHFHSVIQFSGLFSLKKTSVFISPPPIIVISDDQDRKIFEIDFQTTKKNSPEYHS